MLRIWLTFTLLLPLAAQTPARGLRDQQIQDDIRERLARSVIGKDNFKVRVVDGVAYWEGSTTVAQHKGAATRMAKSAKASSVVNNIVVERAAAKAGSKAPAKSTPKPKPAASPPPAPLAEPRRVKVQWGPRPS